METLSKRSFFVLAALLAFTTLRAQTADDIVNKYVAAVGGKDAISSVKSLVVAGTAEVQGSDGPTTVTVVVGKGFKSESEFAGSKVINCVTPTAGWAVNPFAGAATPTAIPADAVKAGQIQLQFDPLANYAANGYKVELAGKDTADYKLKMTGSANNVTFYINQKTYLVDKEVTTISAMGQEIEVTLSFSDYRKIDGGVLFAYAETIEYPQATVNVTYKTVTVNSTIDPTVFDMPKQ